MGLLGALKRLVEWNGVCIYILCPTTLVEKEDLQSWLDVLYAQVITPSDNLSLPVHRQLWSGSVTITGSQVRMLVFLSARQCSIR